MRERFNIASTNNKEPIYSYSESDWVKCPHCGKKMFIAVERKGSKVEIKCRESRCRETSVVEI